MGGGYIVCAQAMFETMTSLFLKNTCLDVGFTCIVVIYLQTDTNGIHSPLY